MKFISGAGETTEIGYVNKNNQKCFGHRGVKGTDHMQFVYKMKCNNCGHEYGSNGSDIHERKCPNCQKGAPGLEF